MELEVQMRARRDAGRKLLIPYVTGGLGREWCEVVRAFAAAGADAIEIGIPFSDPVMDGPTIQEASHDALAGGATPGNIIGALAAVDVDVPLVVMTYYNLVFRGGHERFAASLAKNNVLGAIVPDVPLEELGPWAEAADQAGVATVLLASPVTPDDRLARIVDRSRGFVYGVGLMGVTGERTKVAESALLMGKRLKAATDKPAVIGFGVSTPDQAAQLAAESDGVVVASALMRSMLDGASVAQLGDQLAAMREALDRG